MTPIESSVPLKSLPAKALTVKDLLFQIRGCIKAKQYVEVEALYDSALKQFPEDVGMLHSAAAYYVRMAPVDRRKNAKGIELATKAVDLTKRQDWACLGILAEALLAAGKLDDATRINDEARALPKANARSLDERAKRIAKAKEAPASAP